MSALTDLIADAQAMPAELFERARCATERGSAIVIDLTEVPAQRVALRVSSASISLVEAAGEHFATLSR
jgi:hypothetical protein